MTAVVVSVNDITCVVQSPGDVLITQGVPAHAVRDLDRALRDCTRRIPPVGGDLRRRPRGKWSSWWALAVPFVRFARQNLG